MIEGVLNILYSLTKYLVYSLIALAVYILYEFVYKPYKIKKHFQQYANVHCRDKTKLFLGDMQYYLDDVEKERVYYDNLKHLAPENNSYDMHFELEGAIPSVKAMSAKAYQEMDSLIPSKIDRMPDYMSLGKIFSYSFAARSSTKHEMLRKKNFVASLSLNSSSKYIPSMLKCLEAQIGKWKVGEEHEATHQFNLLTFTIFTLVLFGEDMQDIATRKIKYEDPSGTKQEVELREDFINLCKDHFNEFLHPLSAFFPIINVTCLINPFKRNYQNLEIFRNRLKEVLAMAKDTNSISYKLLNGDAEITKEDTFEDIMAFLLAGTETSSHCLTTVIFYLRKNPEIMQKLRDELKEYGFTKGCDQKVYALQNIHNLNYLSLVIKEALRIDSPTYDTLNYFTKEEVTLCGVKIPKGTLMRKRIATNHWNKNEWQSPEKFIPERFDPESEYFHKPGSDKNERRSMNTVSFSTGIRSCPGQTFAMLEIKVVVAYLVTHLDYSIEQELLEKEGIGFGLGTQFTLPIKITSTMD